MTIEKNFDHHAHSDRIWQRWKDEKAFEALREDRRDAESYCIVIPPPNVTGALHVGHALDNSLQDMFIRYQRMNGKDVLWQPGTDHAGIATQLMVERSLKQQGLEDRRTLGREKFLEKVWSWKEQNGGKIVEQLKSLGASCDWNRERFTMDEGLSKAVLKVFVQLYKEGIIYRDKRLVNWDPKLQTAVSDLEVESIEVNGKLWHFRYPLADNSDRFLVVATTRPETMLGDTAVAVHPSDKRYKSIIGQSIRLPLCGRLIPIVADDHADPETGTGAVKITPAHDFNDFEVGRRHNLRAINILSPEAKLYLKENEAFLEGLTECEDLKETISLDGKDRFEARKTIVERMAARGLVEKIEDHVHMVPHDEKSKQVVIEPFLTDQWYVDAKRLALPAMDAVRQGETKVVPAVWEKTYFNWMENIQPWCISRQLWWGHQIPAWYGPDGEIFVAEEEAEAVKMAEAHYGRETQIVRDEDVLDTWFSSALWPFSTLGWPENTREIGKFYPTSVLITGFDILFFWVARMMMMGIHFLGKVPFETVFLHALVRDENGAKMSKTKGNVIDPMDIIENYGADSLRLTLIALAAQGRDIRMSTSRVEGYRNFATKLWNAARFCEMNGVFEKNVGKELPENIHVTTNRWIVSQVAKCTDEVSEAIENFKPNEAAGAAYAFVWNTFCDWYLELIKPIFHGENKDERFETKKVAAWALDQIIILLHPIMPFITEVLWEQTNPVERGHCLALHAWPKHDEKGFEDENCELEWIIDLISQVRSVRSELNIKPSAKVKLQIISPTDKVKSWIDRHEASIAWLARVESIESMSKAPSSSITMLVNGTQVGIPLAGIVDIEAEVNRLQKEQEKVKSELEKILERLGNEQFVSKAPQKVVDEANEKVLALKTSLDKLALAEKRISSLQ